MKTLYTYARRGKIKDRFSSSVLPRLIGISNSSFAASAAMCTTRLTLFKFATFVCLALSMPMGFAYTKCVVDDSGILLCNLSASLIQTETDASDIVVERAWQPTLSEITKIGDHLRQFSELWCETTLGKSRIQEVSVYTDHKKSAADVALYKDTGRSQSVVGGFPLFKPSIKLYYAGFSDPKSVDPYLGRVLTHEFAHASLKVYDEYIESGANSSPHCFNPLESDNPRRTIMNNHIVYTRFSHSEDYAFTPPPQTAQYRCYGESAWDVLLQPEGCDSNISLKINAWFPRQDYFATEDSCTPAIPSLDQLKNPKQEQVVVDCINDTKAELEITFFSDFENIIIVVDPNIDQEDKATLAGAIDHMITNIVAGGTSRTLVMTDFNGSNTPTFVNATANNKAILLQEFNEIINNPLAEDREIDEALNHAKMLINDNYGDIHNDYNEVVIISNTTTMPSTSTLHFFDDNNIPVHTVGLGEITNQGLRTISLITGGDYYTVSPHDEPLLLSNLVHQSFSFDGTPHTQQGNFTIENGGNTVLELSVPQGSQYAFFDLSWQKSDDGPGNIIIKEPNNTIAEARITFTGETVRSYIIASPMPGLWNISVTGGGSFNYTFTPSVPIEVDVHAGNNIMPRTNPAAAIVYPQPMMIMARVHGDKPLLYAQVTAEITTPDDNAQPVRLELSDNGKSPDRISGDGVYTGIIRNYDDYGDGIYTIKVTASNPDGRAVFDDFGAGTFATDYNEVVRSAPLFDRIKFGQVEATGTQVTLSNDNYNEAYEIEVNGTPYWGKLSALGSTHWFRFRTNRIRGNSSGIHFIELSDVQNFYSTLPPTIDMKLYEQDPNGGEPVFLTMGHPYPFESSSYFITSALEVNKEYLISLADTTDIAVTYMLTVGGFGSSLVSDFEVARARNNAMNSSGGGGSVDHLLLVMLLILGMHTLCKPTRWLLR